MDAFIKDFLHEKMLASYTKKEVAALEQEIEAKKELLGRIKRGLLVHYDENSVSDANDQKLIIRDMYTKLSCDDFDTFLDKCISMFMHADNVRSCYEKYNMELPLWFSEKYGYLFVEK